jgi:hypothetical protein
MSLLEVSGHHYASNTYYSKNNDTVVKTQQNSASSNYLNAYTQHLQNIFERRRVLFSHYNELLKLKEEGLIDDETVKEVYVQHQLLLERDRELIQYDGKYALMCNGELFIGNSLEDALSKSRSKHGKRVYYVELINRYHFPYLFQVNDNIIRG